MSDEIVYAPYLREKEGELRAVRELDRTSVSRVLPIFIALPLTEKENANLSFDAISKREVGAVQGACGTSPCLWDARYLSFGDRGSEQDTRYLSATLRSMRAFGARVIPVVDIREDYHRVAVVGSHASEVGCGASIRLDFDDIQDKELLGAQLAALRLPPSECILIIDLAHTDISRPDELAPALTTFVLELRAIHPWAKIILAASSYPTRNPAEPNNSVAIPEQEWLLWDWMLRHEPDLTRHVVFGDYGADSGMFKFGAGGRPIPHLRYLDGPEWIVSRGTTDYSSIRGVCQMLSTRPTFRGRDFSAGDEFIASCAEGSIRTSDPTRWRSVNMNHHFTEVVHRISRRYGLSRPVRAATHRTPSFFDLPTQPDPPGQ